MNKSLLSNIVEGISFKVNQVAGAIYKPDLGLDILSITYLKHLPKDDVLKKLKLKFGTVYYTSPADLYHSLVEIFQDKIYLQELKENSYILDCGANIGLSAIYLKSICPTATIESFEPDSKNFDLLEKNVRSCGLSNVHLHKKAIWKENTTLRFVNDGSLSSRVSSSPESQTVEVSAVRLRDFMTRPIDFLKIDIEGAEYEVLKDIEDKLHFVNNFFLEYHGKFSQNDQLLEMLEIVKRTGFSFYIREAGVVYTTPFLRKDDGVKRIYDVQLNIFCFRGNP
jgi:FkbM family methyltransferase